ncbi:MAG: AraC family transcriptional regulator [Clostridiales Family XIII bacterium]|jgi:AraC-like DNA-binding protein|nr:AraC family transcriptional regulator [Clostridiales Family XIII bacterium]
MNREKLIRELIKVPPPIQPDLVQCAKGSSIRSSVQIWNDKNIKNTAHFVGFSTRADIPGSIRLYPDDCLKMFFIKGEGRRESQTLVVGANSTVTTMNVYPETEYFMFVPYSHLPLDLAVHPDELLNRQAEAKDVIASNSDFLKCIDEIGEEEDFEKKICILTRFAQNVTRPSYSPHLSEYCALAMCLSNERFMMHDIERFTGYSDRYCREEFKKSYGVSIKRYDRILRFQRVLRDWINIDGADPNYVIMKYGYYDQSHFIKEFKEFTESTPLQFKASINKHVLHPGH